MICAVCQNGYYLKDDACLDCSDANSAFAQCDDKDTPTQCVSDVQENNQMYFLIGKKCVLGSASCLVSPLL